MHCHISNIHPALYDFHHTDPSQKQYDWPQLRQMSDEKIKAELAKCKLLCMFCHRLHHLNHEKWAIAFEKEKYPQQDLNLQPDA